MSEKGGSPSRRSRKRGVFLIAGEKKGGKLSIIVR